MNKPLRRLTISFDPDTKYFIVLVAISDYSEKAELIQPTLIKGAQLHPAELKSFFEGLKESLSGFFNMFEVKIRLVLEKPVNYGKNPTLVKELERRIKELIDCVKYDVFKDKEVASYFVTPQQYKGGVPKEVFHRRILVGTYKEQFETMYTNRDDYDLSSPCKADLADCYGLILFNQQVTTTGGIFNAITG